MKQQVQKKTDCLLNISEELSGATQLAVLLLTAFISQLA